MGIWIAFAFVASMFVLMGRILFSTYRNGGLPNVLMMLDPIDILLILLGWFLVIPVLVAACFDEPYPERFMKGLIFMWGVGIMFSRRRFFPKTVIRFHPKNTALRCWSTFAGIGVPISLLFGFFAGRGGLEYSDTIVWSFYFMAAGLAVVAVGAFVAELRRQPPESEASSAAET